MAERAEVGQGQAIELDQDMAFQRRQWALQPWIWALMGAAVVAALLGLLGDGPLSGRVAENQSLRLTYDAFVRRDAPTRLLIELRRSSIHPEVWLERRYLEAFEVVSISPAPLSVSDRGERLVARFAALEAGAHIELSVKPRRIGGVGGRLGLGASDALRIEQWIYP